MVQRNAERGAVGPGDAALHGLVGGEVGQAQQGHLVVGDELDDDAASAEVAGLEGGVLTRETLAVVVADDDPPHARGLVGAGGGGHSAPLARRLVLDVVHLAVLGIHRRQEHVVGDVVQVATESEKESSSYLIRLKSLRNI